MKRIPIKHYKKTLDNGQIVIASVVIVNVESKPAAESQIDDLKRINVEALANLLDEVKIVRDENNAPKM